MDERNLEEDCKIDSYNLEEELVKQPTLMGYYSEQLAIVSKYVSYLEEEKKYMRSTLILEATKGGEKVIGCKPTGQSIEAWYRTQKDYYEIVDDLIEAEFKKNVLDGAVKSMVDRKKSLEKLCELFQHDYYSEVDTSGNRDRVKKKLKRRLNRQ